MALTLKDLSEQDQANFAALNSKTFEEQCEYICHAWKLQLAADLGTIIELAQDFQAVNTSKNGVELEMIEVSEYFVKAVARAKEQGKPLWGDSPDPKHHLTEPPTEVQFREMMRSVDVDANGKVTLLEFILYLYLPGGPLSHRVHSISYWSEAAGAKRGLASPVAGEVAKGGVDKSHNTDKVWLEGCNFETLFNPPVVDNQQLLTLLAETMADYHKIYQMKFDRHQKMKKLEEQSNDPNLGTNKRGIAAAELATMKATPFEQVVDAHKLQMEVTKRKKKVNAMIAEENRKARLAEKKRREAEEKAADDAAVAKASASRAKLDAMMPKGFEGQGLSATTSASTSKAVTN